MGKTQITQHHANPYICERHLLLCVQLDSYSNVRSSLICIVKISVYLREGFGRMISSNLGMHAQRGLLYLVCKCVCVHVRLSVTTFYTASCNKE